MKLTTKGRYAVTAIVDLALHVTNGPVTLAEVSKRQMISLSYLEQLFSRMRKQGLVVSIRGPGGGYQLGRSTDDINVAEVIAAVNESVKTTACDGAQNCRDNGECLCHELWHGLGDHIHAYFSNITLSDLVKQHNQNLPSESFSSEVSFEQPDTNLLQRQPLGE